MIGASIRSPFATRPIIMERNEAQLGWKALVLPVISFTDESGFKKSLRSSQQEVTFLHTEEASLRLRLYRGRGGRAFVWLALVTTNCSWCWSFFLSFHRSVIKRLSLWPGQIKKLAIILSGTATSVTVGLGLHRDQDRSLEAFHLTTLVYLGEGFASNNSPSSTSFLPGLEFEP